MATTEGSPSSPRTSSFERMLELEKKYKLERDRFRSAQPPVAAPRCSTAGMHDRAPVRAPCPNLHDQQWQRGRDPVQLDRVPAEARPAGSPMSKAVQRSMTVSNLSVLTPPSGADKERGSSEETHVEKKKENEPGKEAFAARVHKQVKFLAPDDGELSDSDSSSICQSPSWEGYGQKKKEKKEAGRRKKEKERAEREAKSTKRRTPLRLSKPPPSSLLRRNSTASAWADPERSRSDSVLNLPHPLPTSKSSTSSDGGSAPPEASSHLRSLPSANPSGFKSETESKRRLPVGGPKLQRDRGGILKNVIQPETRPSSLLRSPGSKEPDTRPSILKPSTDWGSADPVSSLRDSKHTRESCPPSASRTPLLRLCPLPPHSSSVNVATGIGRAPAGHEGKRSGSPLPPWGPNCSEESLDTPKGVERGRQLDGYVRHQRDQSRERAMAGLADEHLVPAPTCGSSARNNTRPIQHRRRPSLTQEAKSIVMRLAGIKPSTAPKPEKSHTRSGSIECPGFLDGSDTSPTPEFSSPLGIMAPSKYWSKSKATKAQDNVRGEQHPIVAEKPPYTGTVAVREVRLSVDERVTSLTASKDPSTASPAKKNRSFKDVAMAAMKINKGVLPSSSCDESAPPLTPRYFTPPDRLGSDASIPPTKPASESEMPSAPPVVESSAVHERRNIEATKSPTLHRNPVEPTSSGIRTDKRISEVSSSSSAFEDVSPLVSRATTPDTSRPQSSKGSSSSMADGSHETLSQVGSLPAGIGSHTRDPSASEPKHENPIRLDAALSHTSPIPGLLGPKTQPGNTNNSQPETNEKRKSTRKSRSKSNISLAPIHSNVETAALEVGIETTSAPFLKNEIVTPTRMRRREHGIQAAKSPLAEKFPSQIFGPKPGQNQESSSETQSSAHRPQPTQGQKNKESFTEQLVKTSANNNVSAFSPELRTYGPTSPKSPRFSPTSANSLVSKQTTDGSVGSSSRDCSVSTPAENPVVAAVVLAPAFSRISALPASSTRSTWGPPSLIPIAQSSGLRPPAQAPARTMLLMPRPEMGQAPATSPAVSSVPTGPSPTPNPMKVRPMSAMPVSILRRNTLLPSQLPEASSSTSTLSSASTEAVGPPAPSALPKRMQAQTGVSIRPPSAPAGPRAAPVAKIFVECCSCKFYHDLPSRVYACMAKPDAVVEDRTLGISGAITTAVKCPWCQHDMSTKCCPGYAAIVYLKERLH